MLRTPGWALTWSIVRLVAAALIVAAIVAQLVRSVSGILAVHGDVGTVLANFFSFFTILSNVVSVVVLVWGGVWYLTRGRRTSAVEPRSLAIALASATTYMLVTGVVYNTLLRGIPLPQGTTVPWSNEVLHVVGPIVLLLDLLLAPRRRSLPWRAILEILIFPLVWVVYTMIRGPLTTNPNSGTKWWYPYPFLDPHNFGNGYGGVAIYIVIIAALIAAFAALVVWVGRVRARRAAR